MSVSPLWPANDERVRAGYARGEPVWSIAAAIGCSRKAVIGRARRLKLPPHSRWTGGHGVANPDIANRNETVVRLVEAGQRPEEVAARFYLKPNHVRLILREAAERRP